MRVRHHSKGKFYTIECPEGSRVVRRSEAPTSGGAIRHDRLIIPFGGEDLTIPADPEELLPMLAEAGQFGLSLVGRPEPEERLTGVACPKCGESDVDWLLVEDDSDFAHCD